MHLYLYLNTLVEYLCMYHRSDGDNDFREVGNPHRNSSTTKRILDTKTAVFFLSYVPRISFSVFRVVERRMRRRRGFFERRRRRRRRIALYRNNRRDKRRLWNLSDPRASFRSERRESVRCRTICRNIRSSSTDCSSCGVPARNTGRASDEMGTTMPVDLAIV